MMTILAFAAMQAGDPYAALGARIPAQNWQALQTYLAQASREPRDGDPPLKPPSFIPQESTPLAAKRLAVESLTFVLDGLHRLAVGPVAADKGRTSEDMVRIENVERLALLAAEVRFAAGERHSAVGVLLDGMTMARRIGRGSTTDRLVGLACESRVCCGFAEHLTQIPLIDCARIRAAVDAILAEPNRPPKDAAKGVRNAFEQPETTWVDKVADPLLNAQAKERAQVRLLRLHMRIEEYRWHNLKLPGSLSAAAPVAETTDPLTASPFRYERAKSIYRLFSEGFPSQGLFELRRESPFLSLASPT